MLRVLRGMVGPGCLAAALAVAAPAQVIHSFDTAASLESRWERARESAARGGGAGGYWIGYRLPKLMDAGLWIGSTGSYVFTTGRGSLRYMSKSPLGELILGDEFSSQMKPGGEDLLRSRPSSPVGSESGDYPGARVIRDLAFLFFFPGPEAGNPDRVRFSNLELPFDLEGRPLFWLDRVSVTESFELISGMYETISGLKERKRLLLAVSLHDESERVIPFLEKVLKSRDPEDLREAAVTGLGEHASDRSLALIEECAWRDSSLGVRRHAVSALEDIRQTRAVDILIDLARRVESREIRKRAVSALADVASRKAETALEGLAFAAEDTEIQKRAVYALEDLPDGRGIPCLIRIARTHSNLTIRKAAINALGDSGTDEAREALIEIIRGK